MTISTRIRGELFHTQASEQIEPANPQLIRLPLTRPPDAPPTTKKKLKKKSKPVVTKSKLMAETTEASQRHGLPWTTDEHDRFLQGLEQYPSGPWKAIAAFVGTRTPRQTMTHAQKYRQKIQRRRRGLLTSSRQPVPVTSQAYCGLVITTSQFDKEVATTSPDAGKSPMAVDTSLHSTDVNMVPIESNWFDKVQVGELDAAFRAFLEVYDPTLFPMDDEGHLHHAFTSEYSVSMDDDASIVL